VKARKILSQTAILKSAPRDLILSDQLTASFLLPGDDCDPKIKWRRWRISAVEQRQRQHSFASSRTWPLHGSIRPYGTQMDDQSAVDEYTSANRDPMVLSYEISDISRNSLNSLKLDNSVAGNNSNLQRDRAVPERFPYPHKSEAERGVSRIRKAEHPDDWRDIEIQTAAHRDRRLISPNEEKRSRSKSSFATLPNIARDGLFGPPLKHIAARMQRLPCFDTLSVKVLNSPDYPAISRSLRMSSSAAVSGSSTPSDGLSSCARSTGMPCDPHSRAPIHVQACTHAREVENPPPRP
jgi:hypothetical protein